MDFRNKKVLLMGLGILGGGVATANWLLKKGARLTITDKKEASELENSIKKISLYNNKIQFVLGEHRDIDFETHDFIVANPDIPSDNRYLNLARKKNIPVETEFSLFLKEVDQRNLIAVTGTRGKTTTVNWIYHFLKKHFKKAQIGGNSPERPLLDVLLKFDNKSPIVVETPSYFLEHIKKEELTPKIAVITNLFQDHLNRHKNMENYAEIKSRIFRSQSKNSFLCLNATNEWTKYFLNQKPNGKVFKFGKKETNAIYVKKGWITLNAETKEEKIFQIKDFTEKWGAHNLENLLAAILVAHWSGVSKELIKKSIETLPQIKFRQETIFRNKRLKVVNDSAATSPEASIAAVKNFKGSNSILITGGTDRELDFTLWARELLKTFNPEEVIFLSGSATEKMLEALNWKREKINIFDNLNECVALALRNAKILKKENIVFSPASKSFEKFKNEYDRGEQFNREIASILK